MSSFNSIYIRYFKLSKKITKSRTRCEVYRCSNRSIKLPITDYHLHEFNLYCFILFISLVNRKINFTCTAVNVDLYHLANGLTRKSYATKPPPLDPSSTPPKKKLGLQYSHDQMLTVEGGLSFIT